MKKGFKQILRPVYQGVMRTPLMRALIRRELEALGVNPWTSQIIHNFIQGDAGEAYGVTTKQRETLVRRFQENTQHIPSGTAPVVHVVLAQEILRIPPEKGDIIECGVWKGASSAALSLVCQLTGRRLKVCDSFQGLPDEGEQLHTGLHTRVYGYYQKGMFEGSLKTVQENIARYGAPEVCDYIPGFFDESLKQLTGPIAFAFLDVDLASSTQDCLRAIWPLLNPGGYIYSDDAGDLELVRIYFDEDWWQRNLNCTAPGFVGSGCGLPLSATHSSLGYTRKAAPFAPEEWKKAPFLHYPDAE